MSRDFALFWRDVVGPRQTDEALTETEFARMWFEAGVRVYPRRWRPVNHWPAKRRRKQRRAR